MAHLAEIDLDEAQDVVNEVIGESQALFGAKLAKKRVDLAFKALKACPNRASTDDLVANGIGFDLALGKLLMPKILQKLQERGTPLGELTQPSNALVHPELEALAPEDA